eukprot:gene8439-5619_t
MFGPPDKRCFNSYEDLARVRQEEQERRKRLDLDPLPPDDAVAG